MKRRKRRPIIPEVTSRDGCKRSTQVHAVHTMLDTGQNGMMVDSMRKIKLQELEAITAQQHCPYKRCQGRYTFGRCKYLAATQYCINSE